MMDFGFGLDVQFNLPWTGRRKSGDRVGIFDGRRGWDEDAIQRHLSTRKVQYGEICRISLVQSLGPSCAVQDMDGTMGQARQDV